MSDPATAAVALIECEDVILLVRRRIDPRDPWSGHWALPGGRRDPGDADLLATCCRECREEVGIDLRREQLVRRLDDRHAGRAVGAPLTVAVFWWRLAQRPHVTLAAAELDYAHWFSVATLPPLAALPCAPLGSCAETVYPFYDLRGTPLWGFTLSLLSAWARKPA